MAQRTPGDPRERTSRPADADQHKEAAETSESIPPTGSDAASAQSARAEEQEEEAAAQGIPQPGAVGHIVQNYTTTYIGVLAGAILDSTVTGTEVVPRSVGFEVGSSPERLT